ncbi:TetR/AcrR family transcriptional regulator [Streptacidiphilus jiangxiensis]|uniref:Regulatory protein, tetR family n=1 Tax=Streptacidiphilus jiangxiensis TaxID=235985 RepID=A0A1H7QXI4_STRJI|nr:helix-turn-helix domain-containing protein [Streptacidiphilus jiangxiensis]SEL52428.1 regulatory protein, tetR family [Streptacidiphilus jiangxiensis]
MTTRAQLLLAAEELFARHGIAEVSLRQISAAAGQRNTAAAHYHFGDRTTLIREVLRTRLETIDARRAALLAEAEPTAGQGVEVRMLVEALVRPLAEQACRPGSHYVRFLQRLFAHTGHDVRAFAELGGFDQSFAVARVVATRLPNLKPDHASARARWAGRLIISALADLEQSCADAEERQEKRERQDTGAATFADPGACTLALIDAVTGLLTAPQSPA